MKTEHINKVAVLADPYAHIAFSETITESFKLRLGKPLGWKERLVTLREMNRTIQDKIFSGKLEVAVYSQEYSTQERLEEIKSLREEYNITETLDEIFKLYIDINENDFIIDGIDENFEEWVL